MPHLTTPNSLYKFMTTKLCHPIRICIQDFTHQYINGYGTSIAKHTYYIIKYEDRMTVRYENDYYKQDVINKYGKDS